MTTSQEVADALLEAIAAATKKGTTNCEGLRDLAEAYAWVMVPNQSH